MTWPAGETPLLTGPGLGSRSFCLLSGRLSCWRRLLGCKSHFRRPPERAREKGWQCLSPGLTHGTGRPSPAELSSSWNSTAGFPSDGRRPPFFPCTPSFCLGVAMLLPVCLSWRAQFSSGLCAPAGRPWASGKAPWMSKGQARNPDMGTGSGMAARLQGKFSGAPEQKNCSCSQECATAGMFIPPGERAEPQRPEPAGAPRLLRYWGGRGRQEGKPGGPHRWSDPPTRTNQSDPSYGLSWFQRASVFESPKHSNKSPLCLTEPSRPSFKVSLP